MLVEGGSTTCRSEEGLSWYPSDSEAKEALRRVVIVSYWATENGVQSSQRHNGPAIDNIIQRISETITDRNTTNEDNDKKRPRSNGFFTFPGAGNSNRPLKARRFMTDADESVVGSIKAADGCKSDEPQSMDIPAHSVSASCDTSVNSELSKQSSPQGKFVKDKRSKPHRVVNKRYCNIFAPSRSAPKPTTEEFPMIKFQGKDMLMCISWHVRGYCRSNCHRSYDHRLHSRKQNIELLSWCTHAMISLVKQPCSFHYSRVPSQSPSQHIEL